MATYPVSFKITKNEKFLMSDNKAALLPPYKSGQIIFVEDTGSLYLDFHDKRTCYTAVEAPGSMHYLGIAASDPTSGEFTLKGKTEKVTPKEYDVVVFGSKEFMYRKGGEDGETLGWYEIGDEDKTSDELVWEEEE